MSTSGVRSVGGEVRLRVAAAAASAFECRAHDAGSDHDAEGPPASYPAASYPRCMASSDDDRSYLGRIGAYKRASHHAAASEHRSLSLADRLARSWALYEAHADSTSAPRDDSGPLAFYERARSLGLLRR